MKAPLIALLALFLCHLPAHADRIGNGGGGVFNEETGEYKTFHGAGFRVEQAYLTDSGLPELAELRNIVRGLGLVSIHQAKVLEQLVPSHGRKYFRVAAKTFTRDEYEKIKDEYRRVFNDDRINIAIYAITDTGEASTYILPEFEKLSRQEKLSILFHETLWMLAPEASYRDILRVDDYMARYLKSRSPESQFQLIAALDAFLLKGREEGSLWGDSDAFRPMSLLGWAFGKDMQSGALKGLVASNGAISLGRLLGPEAVQCFANRNDRSSDAMDSATSACAPLMKAYLLELSDKNPRSLFLKALLGANPIMAIFNSVGSEPLLRMLGIGANHILVLSQKDLYNGVVMVDASYQTWKRDCQRGLFGSSCENVSARARTRFPLISFSARIYVKGFDPPRWSIL